MTFITNSYWHLLIRVKKLIIAWRLHYLSIFFKLKRSIEHMLKHQLFYLRKILLLFQQQHLESLLSRNKTIYPVFIGCTNCLHKTPYKSRFIANSSRCLTAKLPYSHRTTCNYALLHVYGIWFIRYQWVRSIHQKLGPSAAVRPCTTFVCIDATQWVEDAGGV
jgi:hypothetical protein